MVLFTLLKLFKVTWLNTITEVFLAPTAPGLNNVPFLTGLNTVPSLPGLNTVPDVVAASVSAVTNNASDF